jgi:hypothetical protein
VATLWRDLTVDRFRLEARTASSLSHPGICALDAARTQGIVHRDIKPVWVGEKLRVQMSSARPKSAACLT